jgi:hypothetical protein
MAPANLFSSNVSIDHFLGDYRPTIHDIGRGRNAKTGAWITQFLADFQRLREKRMIFIRLAPTIRYGPHVHLHNSALGPSGPAI